MAALGVVPASRVAMDTSSLLVASGHPLTFQATAPKLITSDEFNRAYRSFTLFPRLPLRWLPDFPRLRLVNYIPALIGGYQEPMVGIYYYVKF